MGKFKNGKTQLTVNTISEQNDNRFYRENSFPTSAVNDIKSAVEELPNEISKNTLRVYKTGFNLFIEYCTNNGLSYLPADPMTVVAFIGYLKNQLNNNKDNNDKLLSFSTIKNRISAIRYFHKLENYIPPTDDNRVQRILKGLSRNSERNTEYYYQEAILYDVLEQLLNKVAEEKQPLTRARNSAIIALGMQGGFRRSELASLEVKDLTFKKDMLIVRIRRSKANQTGKREWKELPVTESFAAASYVKNWLEVSGITEGYLFRSLWRNGKRIRDFAMDTTNGVQRGKITGDTVWRVIKKYALSAGLNPDMFGAHSLRSGCVTQLYKNDRDHLYIMGRTGHNDPRSLNHYVKSK